MKKIYTLLLLQMFAFVTFASDYYWVGGSGNWSEYSIHWATSSGGAFFQPQVPTSNDNVIFDTNSFLSPGQIVTVDNTIAYCKNMIWTGAINASTLSSASTSTVLKIFGSLTLNPNMNVSFNGILKFEALNTGQTINTYGKTLSCAVELNGAGGSWTLQDSLVTSSSVTQNNGTFSTNNMNMRANSLAANAGTLNFGTSVIKLTCSSCNTTLSVNSSVNLSAAQSVVMFNAGEFYGGGKQYNKVVIYGTDWAWLYNSNRIKRLDCITSTGSYLKTNNSQHIDSLFCNRNYIIDYSDTVSFAQVSGNVQAYGSGSSQKIYFGKINVNGNFSENNIAQLRILHGTIGGTANLSNNCTIDSLWVSGTASIGTNNSLGYCHLGKDASISGNNTFGTLVLLPSYTYTFGAGKTQTLTGTLTANGSCLQLVTLKSTVTGSQTTLSKSGGSVTLSGALLQDMNATGGAVFTVINGIDNGNNTGWNINPLVSHTYYWVGNGGNWNDPAHWSLSSGGTGGSCVPASIDDVVFDAGSFTLPGQSISVDITSAYCRNMDWSAVTNNPGFSSTASNNRLLIYGSLNFASAMSIPYNGILKFEATTTGKTINTRGKTLSCAVELNGIGGGWTLQDSLVTSSSVTQNNGTFSTNNRNMSANSLAANAGTLNFGTSVIKLTCSSCNTTLSVNSSVNLSAAQSVVMFNAGEFYGGGKQYNKVVIYGTDWAWLYNSNRIKRLDCITSTGSYLKTNNSQHIDSLFCNRNYMINDGSDTVSFAQVSGNVQAYSSGSSQKIYFGKINVNGNFSENNIAQLRILHGTIGGTANLSNNCTIDSLWVSGIASIGTNNSLGYCHLGNNASISGNNTFGTLVLSPSYTYTFSAGKTQTFLNTLEAWGNPGFPIEMHSSSAGTQAIFQKNGGVMCTQYIYIRDIGTSGTALFYAGKGSNDVANNSGWDFNFLTPCSPLVKGAYGKVYNDMNANCAIDAFENPMQGVTFIIQPGNYVAQSNIAGIWKVDSIPAGTYTITIDTTLTQWTCTCPVTQTFIITDPNALTAGPDFGVISNYPCADPDISVYAPILRRCMSNQMIYINVTNAITATGPLDSAYANVKLDNLLVLQSANLPYTSLGNNMFRFQLGDLLPGQTVSIVINSQVSCGAVLNQTLCIEAKLYPVQSCFLDSIPSQPTGEVSPCTLPWDHSSLNVNGWCQNDSIYFTVTNTGNPGGGDMDCYSPVRIYLNGLLLQLDSIMIPGGQTVTYIFPGTGQTWRLEADQHPLHPGNSHPNATVELCGNQNNWTPNLVNVLPLDDADPIVDIYCGVVTGSIDPNDKTGYPLGLTSMNYIKPNLQLQYVIRFQNTGTDTALTIVVRDTLDLNLNILSVTPGVTSHPASFRMLGQRVLEWTFNNILLPDSNTNEPESRGFVTFHVDQIPNLPNGTIITNDADIYFDYNQPITTNQTFHTVNDQIQTATCDIVFTTQPLDQNVTVGDSAVFFITVSDTNATYQWQTNIGTGFQNISNNGQYFGVTNDTLIVKNALSLYDNQQFRCIVTLEWCSDTSNIAILTVNVVGNNEAAVAQQQIRIYPNPTNGTINVHVCASLIGSTFTITNQFGRTLITGKLNAENSIIDLGNLSGNVYMLSVGDNVKLTFKIIKN